MGDRNIFQPSAAATLLTSLEDVQVSALMMASRQNEVLQTILEIEKSLPELCERKEMKKSLAALFAQQNQLVDLTNSMSEQLCSLQTSRPETTEIPNSTRTVDILLIRRLCQDVHLFLLPKALNQHQLLCLHMTSCIVLKLRRPCDLFRGPSFESYDPDQNIWEKMTSFPFYNDYDTHMDITGYAVCYGIILFSFGCRKERNFDVIAFHISRNEWKRVKVHTSVYFPPFLGRAVVIGKTIYSLYGEEFIAFSFKTYKADDGSLVYYLSQQFRLQGLEIACPPLPFAMDRSEYLVHLGNLEFFHVNTRRDTGLNLAFCFTPECGDYEHEECVNQPNQEETSLGENLCMVEHWRKAKKEGMHRQYTHSSGWNGWGQASSNHAIAVYFWEAKGQNPLFPRIYGHEAGGIVESVGEGVTDLKAGDHVLPVFTGECKDCAHCKSEESNMCDLLRINTDRGVMLSDGKSRFSIKGKPIYHFVGTSTFSEYTVVHVGCLAKINPLAPLDKVCVLSCGISTGLGATLNVAKPKKGSTVAVFGLGAVGLAAAEGARISGASRIIGVDLNSSRFEGAKKFGVTEFVNPKDHKKPVQEVIAELTNGGVDRSIECTGNVEAMISAFECAHDGWGVAVLVGVPHKEAVFKTHPVNFLNERTLKGTFFGNYKPRTDIPSVVEKYMNNELELEKFITHKVPFSEINKAFDYMLKGEGLRCIIHMEE
ncbi:unnamed protein product [Prunus armeniaca]